jgi:hypothetical protein
MWARFFSIPNKGVPALEQYDHERAHVAALHRAMIAKGCVPLDLDRELAASDAAIAEVRKR